MAPEEILNHIDAQNRALLYARPDLQMLTHEQVLELMNMAAMRSFRFGSETALSMVKSQLVMKYFSESAAGN